MTTFESTGRFTRVRRLGAGGMGVVYEAFDRSRDMPVALKVLHDVDASSLYRFKREFRSLAEMAHSNLVTLYELVSEKNLWFFTMELIDGVDLIEYVRGRSPGSSASGDGEARDDGGYDAARLRSSLVQLANALRYVHETGRVHRDVKPPNVLVTSDGRVVLMDFGIIAEQADSPHQSTGAAIVGTAAYMAPEQAGGDRVTAAADWYAMGVVLYEALTGAVPFTGESSVAQIMAKMMGKPTPPSEMDLSWEIDPELESLCLDLLEGNPADRPGYAEILGRLGAEEPRGDDSTPPAESIDDTSFVGRTREIKAMQRAAWDVARGSGVCLLVGGDTGMGKTRLVQHYLEGLSAVPDDERPPLILAGRCYQRENVPYKAFDGIVDALSHALMLAHGDERRDALPDEVALLGRLFPVLDRVPGVIDDEAPPVVEIHDPQEQRARGFRAFHQLLSRVARRHRLVLWIDDLHWADEDSMELLEDLARPPGLPPALLIACYRREEVASNELLRRFLDRVDGWGDVRRVEVGPLSMEETRALSSRLLADTDAAVAALRRADAEQAPDKRIWDESGGSPLFVREICRYIQTSPEEGEPSGGGPSWSGEIQLIDVIGARVARLTAEARLLLERLAVSGEPLPQPVLAASTEIPPPEIERTVAQLAMADLVRFGGREDDVRIQVFHDRIREVVTALLSPGASRAHHASLAQALEGWEQAPVESLARHWKGAGEEHRAAEYAQRAAREAVAQLAFERGGKLYRMALEYEDPGSERAQQLLEALGDCLVNAGRSGEAADAYLEAARGPDRSREIQLRRLGVERLMKSGRIEEGLRGVAAVLAQVGIRVPNSRLGAILRILWSRLKLRIHGLRWTERRAEDVPAALLEKLDLLWAMASCMVNINPLLGTSIGLQMYGPAFKAGEPRRLALSIMGDAMMRASLGGKNLLKAEQMMEVGLVLIHKAGDPYHLAFTGTIRGIISHQTGRWRESLAFLDEAEQSFREKCRGASWERALAHQYILRNLLCMGRLDEIAGRLPGYLRDATLRNDWFALSNLKARFGIVWLARDDLRAAEEHRRGALETWPAGLITIQHFYDLVSHLETLLYAGEVAEAAAMMEEGFEHHRRSAVFHAKSLRCELLFFRGRVALAAVAGGLERQRFVPIATKMATAMRKEKGHAYFRGCALLLAAGVAHHGGDTSGAVDQLTEAVASFESADSLLHAHATRRVKGPLVGGSEGEELIEAADRWMSGIGIRDAGRMAAMIAPGFG